MADKALIKNGKIVVIDRAGVKTIPTVAGDVKSIEVTLTENVPTIDIDLTSLNLIEGSIFNVYYKFELIDINTLLPVNARVWVRINNISNVNYFYTTTLNNGFFMTASDSTKINAMYSNCNIIAGDFIGKYDDTRISTSDARLQTNWNCGIRNENITQITNFLFTAQSSLIKTGGKVVITKLN